VNTILRFHDVTLGYERHPAVHHLSGALRAGSLTAVVGPNGAGKSTLLKGMVGLLRPLAGSIRGEGLGRGDIAYLPQQAEIDRTFPISVFDTVQLGHWHKVGPFGAIDGALVEQALAALDAQDSLYGQGVLGEERAASRIDALCALGRRAEARAAAARFLADHPHSLLAPRVAAACEGVSSP